MRTKLDERFDQPAQAICRGMEQVGRCIRLRRKELRLNQTQVAQMVPCSQRLISELERGRGSVAFETVLRVAACLGIDIMTSVRGKQ